jgi:hypothetical protein
LKLLKFIPSIYNIDKDNFKEVIVNFYEELTIHTDNTKQFSMDDVNIAFRQMLSKLKRSYLNQLCDMYGVNLGKSREETLNILFQLSDEIKYYILTVYIYQESKKKDIRNLYDALYLHGDLSYYSSSLCQAILLSKVTPPQLIKIYDWYLWAERQW